MVRQCLCTLEGLSKVDAQTCDRALVSQEITFGDAMAKGGESAGLFAASFAVSGLFQHARQQQALPTLFGCHLVRVPGRQPRRYRLLMTQIKRRSRGCSARS